MTPAARTDRGRCASAPAGNREAGWLEDSVNGGAWTDVSPQVTLPATRQGLVDYPWAKTGNYYAGPGTSVRACVLTPATPTFPAETDCSSSSVTLASSTAAPPDDGTSVFYDHNPQAVNENSGLWRHHVFRGPEQQRHSGQDRHFTGKHDT